VTRWSPLALLRTTGLSLLLWAVVAAGCVFAGSTGLGLPSTPKGLAFRLEVVLLSSLVGAALAAAGVTYQAILRNPLADPYLLGVSSGAALFAYLWRLPALAAVTGPDATGVLSFAATQQAFAFIGAVVSVGWVLLIGSRRGRIEPVTVLLVGVIVNALNGSIFLLTYFLAETMPSSGGALAFIVGVINTSLTSEDVWSAATIVALGWLALLAISGQLNAAGVGDAEAESLGVRIQRLRWAALIVASLVTAAAVAVSGPIGFIGLICPHLARLMVGTDQRRLLPVATALGAALLAAADATSRGLTADNLVATQLPVGVLTSLLGGPFFLLLLVQNRRRVELAEGLR
jgi:iron complex transport system permease protein